MGTVTMLEQWATWLADAVRLPCAADAMRVAAHHGAHSSVVCMRLRNAEAVTEALSLEAALQYLEAV